MSRATSKLLTGNRASALPRSRGKQPAAKVWTLLGKKARGQGRLSNRQVTYVFRHLSTLLENGVSLPKALATLADEEGTESYREVLESIHRRIENGEAFSSALSHYRQTFDQVVISQVKVGERAGTLGEALAGIATQREKASHLRGEIMKKLAYPMILTVVGSGVIAFLLTYVVPVFEKTYRDARVPLPGITQSLIMVGAFAKSYLWMVVLAAIAVALVIRSLRRNDQFAYKMDAGLLKIPVIGSWLRSLAILEMMDVLGDLMEAGFTLAEALAEAGNAVKNRAVKRCVRDLERAIFQGERFSREMERHRGLFPPIVSQLVIIGEQTGRLTRSTRTIRGHLRSDIERKANIFVGVIEPTLTITMAAAVAMILLSIYLPMFDMINTVK